MKEPTEEEVDAALDDIIEVEKRDQTQPRYPMTTERDTSKSGGKSPVHVLVDRLGEKPGQYKTTAQVAAILGTSQSTIRRIAKADDGPGPSFYTHMGELQVALYTAKDIAALRKHLNNQHRLIPAEKVRG